MRPLHVAPSNLHTKLPPTTESCQVTRKSVCDTQTPENRVCPAGHGCRLCSPGDGASPASKRLCPPRTQGLTDLWVQEGKGRPRLKQPSTVVGPSTHLSRVRHPPHSQPRMLCMQRGAGDKLVPLARYGHFSEPPRCLPMAGRW